MKNCTTIALIKRAMESERLAIVEYNHLLTILRSSGLSLTEVNHIIKEEKDHLTKDLPSLLKKIPTK
jgi:rubrerythrin